MTWEVNLGGHLSCNLVKKPNHMEPETCLYTWLFQLNDSNLYIGNGCFTKHPFKASCLEFQANDNTVMEQGLRPKLAFFFDN